MFPVEKMSQFESTNASYRILKPWWDVLTDYLSTVMLIIALAAGAMQVVQGDLICLPAAECIFNLSKVAHDSRNGNIPVSRSFLGTNHSFCQKYYASASRDSRMTVIALTKLEDRRQYDFVDAQCGQEAVHWFASYLPLILFLQAVIFVIVDNFWLKFPKTSSTINHFVKLVFECFDSPWADSLSNDSWGTRNSGNAEGESLPTKSEEDVPYKVIISSQSDRDPTLALELSEAIKAWWLSVKVRHFQTDVEHEDHRFFLVRIYLAQAILQCSFSLIFFIFNIHHHSSVRSTVKCDIDVAINGHYNYFKCSYPIAVYFHITLGIFYVLITPYFLLCVFICFWTAKKWKFKTKFTFNCLQKFVTGAFEPGDIDDASGDFTFLLHLLKEYNELYYIRFALFLSNWNEKNLKELILLKQWPRDKLERMRSEDGTELTLSGLSGIPKTIFLLTELESLVLCDCSLTEEDFDSKDWKKLHGLKLLSLVRCHLKSIPEAICQNCRSLRTLYLSDNEISSVPENIADLHHLISLSIAGNNLTEGLEHIIKIENLQVLDLKKNEFLQNVPNQIADHPNLEKLYVDETVVSKMSEELRETLGDKIQVLV